MVFFLNRGLSTFERVFVRKSLWLEKAFFRSFGDGNNLWLYVSQKIHWSFPVLKAVGLILVLLTRSKLYVVEFLPLLLIISLNWIFRKNQKYTLETYNNGSRYSNVLRNPKLAFKALEWIRRSKILSVTKHCNNILNSLCFWSNSLDTLNINLIGVYKFKKRLQKARS